MHFDYNSSKFSCTSSSSNRANICLSRSTSYSYSFAITATAATSIAAAVACDYWAVNNINIGSYNNWNHPE
jgi:hypothetical protein